MSVFKVIAAMLCISHLSHMSSEEYSLGQEDKIVVIEDIAGNEVTKFDKEKTN